MNKLVLYMYISRSEIITVPVEIRQTNLQVQVCIVDQIHRYRGMRTRFSVFIQRGRGDNRQSSIGGYRDLYIVLYDSTVHTVHRMVLFTHDENLSLFEFRYEYRYSWMSPGFPGEGSTCPE